MDSKQKPVLILTPFGDDADDLAAALREEARCQRCHDLPQLLDSLRAGAAAVVVAEEAFKGRPVEDFFPVLSEEPLWSSVPFLLLVRRRAQLDGANERLLQLFDNTDLTILERPVRASILARNVRSCLHGRRRQYQIHNELLEQQGIGAILQMRVRQQRAIAELGQRALSEKDLSAFLDDCAKTVASVLGNEYCKILELLPSRDKLLLRAGAGWKEGLVGTATLEGGLHSHAGYTLSVDAPVIVEDLRTEERFSAPALLTEHHVVSGMSCVIAGDAGEPWGVLGTHTRRRQLFTGDDINFLRAAANILSEAIQRHGIEQDLRESERRFREMIDALPAAIYTTDAEGRLTHFNPAAIEFSGRVPELGNDHWCITWKLYRPDGTPLPLEESPMAIALKEGRIIRGAEVIAEHPDGKRIWFTPYPTLLHNPEGKIIGGINMLVDITDRKRAERILRWKNQQRALARGQEEERKRIAGELHDDIGQRMAFLTMQLDQFTLSPKPEEISRHVQSFRTQLDRLCDDVRALSHRLHPSLLDLLGLKACLEAECERVSQLTVPVHFASDPLVEDLPPDLKLAVYRVVQEALHNIVEHAEAQRANVTLSIRGDELQLKIEDDGKGFDPSAVHQCGNGLGLLSITERLGLFEGRLSIDSQRGKGTRIQAIVPLRASALEQGKDSLAVKDLVDRLDQLPA